MKIVDWGLIEYESAVTRQLNLVEQISEGGEETIVICSHPPVVTLGRATEAGDVDGWTGSTIETSRGGRATYHGPNQIVIYPILNLKNSHCSVPERDVHAYLRTLEKATVACLHGLGLEVEVRTARVGEISLTGVWHGEKKIASIGIAVRKWVTYHGVAINVIDDPSAFRGIRPCGFQSAVMTSVEAELGQPVNISKLSKTFGGIFGDYFAVSSEASAKSTWTL